MAWASFPGPSADPPRPLEPDALRPPRPLLDRVARPPGPPRPLGHSLDAPRVPATAGLARDGDLSPRLGERLEVVQRRLRNRIHRGYDDRAVLLATLVDELAALPPERLRQGILVDKINIALVLEQRMNRREEAAVGRAA